MKNNRSAFVVAAVAAAAVGPLAGPAAADIIDWEVGAQADLEYQDNVLRLPDDTDAGPGRSKSDLLTTYGAGAEIGVNVSQQRFFLTGGVNRTTYRDNSYLDSNGIDVEGGVDWKVTPRCGGTVAASYNEEQTDLGLLLTTASNVTTTTGAEASAGCLVYGYYRPEVMVFTQSTENSLASQAASDVDSNGVRVSVAYARDPLSSASVRMGVVERDYPNRLTALGTPAEESRQWSAGVTAKRRITGKTSVEGGIGVSKFTGGVESDPLLDFDVALHWQATPKLGATLAVSRSVDVSTVVESNYQTEQREELTLTYDVSPFVDLAASISYSSNEYEAVNAGGSFQDRSDDTLDLTTGAVWQVNRIISLQAEYGYTNQSSNIARGNYDANSVMFGVRATY